MNRTALVLCFRKYLADRFHHTVGFIANDELYTAEAAGFQPDEEVFPAFQIFFEAFRGAKDLAIAVTGDADRDKD